MIKVTLANNGDVKVTIEYFSAWDSLLKDFFKKNIKIIKTVIRKPKN